MVHSFPKEHSFMFLLTEVPRRLCQWPPVPFPWVPLSHPTSELPPKTHWTRWRSRGCSPAPWLWPLNSRQMLEGQPSGSGTDLMKVNKNKVQSFKILHPVIFRILGGKYAGFSSFSKKWTEKVCLAAITTNPQVDQNPAWGVYIWKWKWLTNSRIRIRQLTGTAVVGFQRERLSAVKGQHFGERCCMVLRKNLTITKRKTKHLD